MVRCGLSLPYRRSRVVCRSVCRSVTTVSSAKTAELMEMPIGMWTQVGQRNRVSDGGLDPHMRRGNFEGRRPRTCPDVPDVDIYSKRLSRGQHRYGVDADSDILDGVHIGGTWRIRLNSPCSAALRPHVKLV